MATAAEQSGSATVTLADEDALRERDPEPECEVALTRVDFSYRAAGGGALVTTLTVRGLAWGADRVRVAVASPWLRPAVTGTGEVDQADHGWLVELDLADAPLPYGAVVTVRARTREDDDDDDDADGCDAETERVVVLGVGAGAGEVLRPADGCPAGFELVRAGFVAGHADRLVRSTSFVPLLCSFRAVIANDRMQLTRMVNKLGVTRSEAFEQVGGLLGRLDVQIGELEERAAAVEPAGEQPRLALVGGMPAVLAATGRAVAETVRGIRGEGGEGGDEHARRERAGLTERPGVGDLEFGLVEPPVTDAEPLDPAQAFLGYEGVTATAEGVYLGVRQGVARYVNLGWLGVLFYDRLRFRPAGLVAGDQVFSLSLAPGEEATLTQRSETRRSRSFEEVVDRTVERELEFSSTWSTDFSQADTSTHASTTSGNLGVGVGIPIEGVQINVNAAVSATEAHTISQTVQRSRGQEVTTRVTARSREQHKTTFKVSTDITEELGSKRVLRNTNPSRALTLNVYKLYQKYRILLERFDARLCVSLGVHDPGRDLRRELEQELAKLDPHVPPGACPAIPVGGPITQSKRIDNLNATEIGGDEFGREMFSTVLPTGTLLSGWTFDITSWTVDDGGGNVYSADPTQFTKWGGKWGFASSDDIPVIGSPGAQSHVIVVLMPEAWGPGWWTVNVTGTFTWTAVPSDAVTTEVRACMEAEKKKIRDSFSSDRVMEILAEVRASRRELIYKRVFEEVLLPGYFAQGMNPPMDLLERVRNYFDWNESAIEFVPWWMTAYGRTQRDLLLARLLKLPGDTRSDLIVDDFLIASMARVYLPVKPGLEKEVVDFLIRVGGQQLPSLDACIDEFTAWRQANLGAVGYPLPTYEQVMGTGPETGTATGEDDWAHDWERPRRRFLVMDEWSDLLPTDGVHIEPVLSTCGSTDEYRSSALVSDLRAAAAVREVHDARAELERSLAGQEDLDATVVIGDPTVRPAP
jgi:hypothetical protein